MLKLNKEQMRKLGYQAIDMLVEHIDSVSDKPVGRKADCADLAVLREPIPEHPSDPTQVLPILESSVFANIMHLDHPRFFAFVPSPGNYVSAIANLLSTGHNVFSGTWLEGSAPGEIELVTIDWLREICELPSSWGGLFTSGGSIANLTALATARHVQRVDQSKAIVYFSDQSHFSIRRTLSVLGFHDQQLREIPSDEELRLPVDDVQKTLRQDREAGLQPLAIVANAGTTNSGAVDSLDELGSLAESEGLWLHVDAAYGGPAMLTAQGKSLLNGLGKAHSITLDPHKWLFQPYDIGCLLVRDPRWLEDTFRFLPEYLQDAAGAYDEVNFCDRGIELTRPFRALKLWMTFKVFGLNVISAAVQRGIEHAEFAESEIQKRSDWNIMTPAQLGIVTFRYEPPHLGDSETDALNRSLPAALIDDTFAFMSTTELRGRTVCRLCTINPNTTEDDIVRTVEKLNTLAQVSRNT